MVHSLDKSVSDKLILEIYNVNTFLALNCIATYEKNEWLEQTLLEKMSNDIKIKAEHYYKATLLSAYYLLQERNKAIIYLKVLNEDQEIYKIVDYLRKYAEYDLLIQIFSDAIFTRSDNVIKYFVRPDKNCTLYCELTKVLMNEYIIDCYEKKKYEMLILFMALYEEQINIFQLIGESSIDFISKVFDMGINVKKYERFFLNKIMSKDITTILNIFYAYSSSNCNFEKRLSTLIGKQLIENNSDFNNKELNEIRAIVYQILESTDLAPKKRAINFMEKYIDDNKFLENDGYIILLELESVNPYCIYRKKKKLFKFEKINDIDKSFIKEKILKLLRSNLTIEQSLYIYLNTKLCEYFNLEKFIHQLYEIKHCNIVTIMDQLSRYKLYGYIKRISNNKITIRCTSIDIAKLIELDLDSDSVNLYEIDGLNENMSIEFYINRYQNGILFATLFNKI